MLFRNIYFLTNFFFAQKPLQIFFFSFMLSTMALGFFAVGFFAVGLFAMGYFTVGFFTVGLFAVGQFAVGTPKNIQGLDTFF